MLFPTRFLVIVLKVFLSSAHCKQRTRPSGIGMQPLGFFYLEMIRRFMTFRGAAAVSCPLGSSLLIFLCNIMDILNT